MRRTSAALLLLVLAVAALAQDAPPASGDDPAIENAPKQSGEGTPLSCLSKRDPGGFAGWPG